MPAKDNFHDIVKNALIGEGWKITHDPYFMRYGDTEFYIDLGAEKVLAAEKEGRKIAVEIKSFLADSVTYEFHAAMGQFVNYRNVLEETEPDRALYLAVPSDIYDSFFKSRFGQMAIRKSRLRLIVCNIGKKEIEEWTD
jgi:hypothetical protein